MTGEFIVAEIVNHEEIEGADKIVSSKVFGETIIIDKEKYPVGTKGLLFDCETQLSELLCNKLNLYRHSELNEDKQVIGYFDDNRRVRPIRLKGVKCSAFFLSFKQLEKVVGEIILDLGTQGTEVNSIELCKKYYKVLPKRVGQKEGKAREDLVPLFKEHFDTDQLMRNLQKLEDGNLITVTEKLHGTSCRCGYLPVKQKANWWTNLVSSIALFLISGKWLWENDYEDYDFVVGSRRVLKSISGEEHGGKQHYYGHDLWTIVAKEHFEGKLNKGETVYFEIVGYDLEGNPIMGSHSNEKLKKFMDKREYKDFLRAYGSQTIFNYGCLPRDQKVFVYRITMTNEDGVVYDLTWDQVKLRCEMLNVNHVPELKKFIYSTETKYSHWVTDQEEFGAYIEDVANDKSLEFPMHLREGVCVRVDNEKMVPMIFKHKGYLFKVLEGIIKDTEVENIEEVN